MWRSKKLVIFSALVVATLSFFVYQKVVAATAPDLKEGTYLTGQTLSVWPSWSTLGNSLGQALPIDPINQLGLAGTCARRTGVFCTTDSQCESPVNTTSEKCVLHDPETGWSTADRRFAFVCSKDSYAYRYIVSTTPGFYTVRARFEDTGIPVANFNSFAAGFVSTSVFIINNSSGICNQDPEISTMQAGTCGDGKLNLNKGEQCDPPGTIEYKTGCRGTIKDLSVCNSNCQWVASTTKCSSLSRCGNGVLESGETCDDGSLNGKYNHCGINCSSVSALGRCGDNTLQSAYEVCDPGTPGQEKYALTQNNSCAWDCQNFGPYCGDAVTQTEHGEDCDGNQSCTVDGKQGVKVCTSGCKKVMSAAAPTEWECKVGSTATAAVSAPGTCGDAVVGANEACDKGLSNNGRACVPVYDKSCSYCSADCQNTIDVQPTQYCGNGYIESVEKCDVFNGAIYSVAASVSSTLANKDSARNGYQELACMGEPTDPHTLKKGTKSCDSCTGGVARNCITCGVDKNGVAVGGGIINVLDKADPLFAKVPGSGGGSLSLAIGACFDVSTGQQYAAPRYIPGQGWVGGAPPSRCYDPTFSGSLILGRDTKNGSSPNLTTYNLLNSSATGNALVNSAPICSTDTNADYKYRMYVNDNWARPFDFPVLAAPATWQYDMVLSPVVTKATRSKDLRIVASWVGSADFRGGVLNPFVVAPATPDLEGASFPGGISTGVDYQLNTSNVFKKDGIWYHGFNFTPGQTNAESFTIDTSAMIGNTYVFYMRAPSFPIRTFKNTAKLKVDVYLPEDDTNRYHFGTPVKTYFFTAATPSENQSARYWQVFNINKPVSNLSAADILDVNAIVTGPARFIYFSTLVSNACTDADWQSATAPTTCPSSGTQTRSWTKTGSCTGGIDHPATETVGCTYVPPVLTASCSVSPAAINVGQSATWTATASGGTGSYSYLWSGSETLGSTNQTFSKTYTSNGVKTGTVYVTSGFQTITQPCSNSVTVSTVIPACTDANWSSTLSPAACPFFGQTQTKTWTKIGTCIGGVTHPASETVSCTFSPPSLTASCSVSPTAINVGQSATWSAVASGGTGSYSYMWSGTDSLGSTSQTFSKTYGTAGVKSGAVYVTSGSQTITQPCNNNVTVSTVVTAPAAPVLNLSSVGNGQVNISWTTPSTGGSPITGYSVHRGVSPGNYTDNIPVGNTNFYSNTSLTNGVKYYYTVKAINAVGAGPASNEISGTPQPVAPASIPNLTGGGGFSSPSLHNELNWAAPTSNGGAPITGYRVYRRTSATTETLYAQTNGSTFTYSDFGVSAGGVYYYRVTAVNSAGESPFSNQIILSI